MRIRAHHSYQHRYHFVSQLFGEIAFQPVTKTFFFHKNFLKSVSRAQYIQLSHSCQYISDYKIISMKKQRNPKKLIGIVAWWCDTKLYAYINVQVECLLHVMRSPILNQKFLIKHSKNNTHAHTCITFLECALYYLCIADPDLWPFNSSLSSEENSYEIDAINMT